MSKRKHKRRRVKGFTLLEVLLVLAILVILGSMVTVYFAKTQDQGYRRAAKIQINLFEQLMDQYRINNNTYPNTQQGLMALLQPPAELANPDNWGGPYTKKAIPPDPWGNPYQYQLDTAYEFRIWSFGPDGSDGSGDEISNL
jgi:general secretion pathway protein G